MLLHTDARMIPLLDASVQCVVTSPPYWGLRDYKLEPLVWGEDERCEHDWGEELINAGSSQRQGTTSNRRGCRNTGEQMLQRDRSNGCWCQSCGAWRGSLGLEPTPDLYVQHLVEIFREVRRVLRDDGTVWLVMGDCYQSGNRGAYGRERAGVSKNFGHAEQKADFLSAPNHLPQEGLKDKDLVGVPWMIAFALRADGWYLRSEIVWVKGYSFHPTTAGSCMPESVRDRPTRGHEIIFLLTKSAHYLYDAAAVKEVGIWPKGTRAAKGSGTREGNRRGGLRKKDVREVEGERRQTGSFQDRWDDGYATYSGQRNLRSVWLINPQPYRGAHFATFPPKLVEPCVRAGSRPQDVVLDPFCGSGTVGVVCAQQQRRFVGLDLNPAYLGLAQSRGVR